MKKNLFYSAALIAGLSMLTSCANDDLVRPDRPGQEVEVVFTASLPDNAMSTRMFSDGNTAKNLTYVVYESGSQDPLIDGTAIFTDRQTTVKLNLITGKEYDIVFWAQAGGKDGAKCYSFSAKDQTVTVDYSKVKTSRDLEDAFFTCKTIEVTGSTSLEAELKRPFAQINVGTDDLTYALAQYTGKNDVYTAMKVTSVYNTLNLKDGTVSTTEAPEFGATTVNRTQETFPVQKPTPLATGANQYKYLNMGYVLVGGDDKITADVDLDFYFNTDIDGNGDLVAGATPFRTLPVTGVPLQRNYRTNIYGSLLTSTVDIKVIIVPDFDGKYGTEYGNPMSYQEFSASSVQDLKDALNNVSDGVAALVIAEDDLTLDSSITASKNLILDMKDNTLDLNGNYVMAKSGALVEVIGGEINTSGAYGFVSSGDKTDVIISDCTINDSSVAGRTVQAQKNGNVDMYNVTLNTTDSGTRGVHNHGTGKVAINNSNFNTAGTGVWNNDNGTVVISNSTITNKSLYGVLNWANGNIEISDSKLTSKGAQCVVSYNNSTTTLKNVDVTQTTVGAAVWAAINSTMHIEGGTITSTANTTFDATNCVVAIEGTSTVDIKGATVKATGDYIGCVNIYGSAVATITDCDLISEGFYGFSTNASNPSWASNVAVERCNISGSTGVLVTIQDKYNFKDCNISGYHHAAMVRGGDVSFTNCKFNFAPKCVAANYIWKQYDNEDWNSGELAPAAALTIGNRGTRYQYATKLTLVNSPVTMSGAYASEYPSVYAWANQGAGIGVTFNYDAASTIPDPMKFGSANIVVNGETMTPNL